MCHQTAGLAARHLEDAGIPTVLVGSARDIVEEVGVPRFVFTDLPLGNPFGPPDDAAGQRATLEVALEVADGATRPRTTVHAPIRWPHGHEWRSTFMTLDDPEALAREGEERRARQTAAKRAT